MDGSDLINIQIMTKSLIKLNYSHSSPPTLFPKTKSYSKIKISKSFCLVNLCCLLVGCFSSSSLKNAILNHTTNQARASKEIMERKKSWLSSMIKNSFFLRTKDILSNAASNLRHKAKEKSDGFVSLYKDMEACAEYADIQVMWEMIHSSSPHDVKRNRSSRKFKCWKFCFQQV